MKTYRYKLTLTEPILGTASANKDIHSEYIASKSADAKKVEEELAALPAEEKMDKAKTVFHRDTDGKPMLFDYQVRGFFKEALRVLIECGAAGKKLNPFNHKTAVDSMLFVFPRRILIELSGKVEDLTRPLRAETMQGPRVALATSEMIPAGSTLEFEIRLMEAAAEKAKWGISEEIVKACLDYGALKGLGQWRSGSYGRFTWSEITAK